MSSRAIAALATAVALAFAVTAVGCSKPVPPPTVDNTNVVESTSSVEATLGIETTITVGQLKKKLTAAGLKVKSINIHKGGLFLPAKFNPISVDEMFVQTYRFKNKREAKGAAGTVEADGYILGATPTQPINVNWTGRPAFFRSGDLIVIFVSEKVTSAKGTRVFKALKAILGEPFMGGIEPLPSTHPGSTAPSTGTAPATTSVPATAGS